MYHHHDHITIMNKGGRRRQGQSKPQKGKSSKKCKKNMADAKSSDNCEKGKTWGKGDKRVAGGGRAHSKQRRLDIIQDGNKHRSSHGQNERWRKTQKFKNSGKTSGLHDIQGEGDAGFHATKRRIHRKVLIMCEALNGCADGRGGTE